MYEPLTAGIYKFKLPQPAYKGKRRFALVPVEIEVVNGMYILAFGFNNVIKDKVKTLKNRRFDWDTKTWRAPVCQRNNFNLRRFIGEDVFGDYDADPNNVVVTFSRPLFDHQKDLVKHGLSAKRVIWAAEMGTGKTLAGIELMERSGKREWWWVGPKSAVAAVKLDFRKWDAQIKPTFMTYEGMVKRVKEHPEYVPEGVIFDESSKLKTETAKRSQYALALANAIRDDHDGYVILMSGTPAPKSPVDWWNQTEVACPGFLLEGSANTLQYRLAHFEQCEGVGGQTYPKLVAWKDSDDVCSECGKHENDLAHSLRACEQAVQSKLQAAALAMKAAIKAGDLDKRVECKETIDRLKLERERIKRTKDPLGKTHQFVRGVNEVDLLYQRMKGLTLVKWKKDCLDLPDKVYRRVHCEIPLAYKRAADLIKATEKRTITALAKLRELSDGFLYDKEQDGTTTCQTCEGNGQYDFWWDEVRQEHVLEGDPDDPNIVRVVEATCDTCNGSGQVPKYKPVTKNIEGPKEKVLAELLEEFDGVGRVVIFAGFKASIDKCVAVCDREGWETIRVDGRGWKASYTDRILPEDALLDFQSPDRLRQKCAIILHPQSGGMGLTLTASPVAIYYSNDFQAENRIQSEDRIHRTGMDLKRGATIIDITCLETDQLILDNLQKKRDLQRMSMGDITAALEKDSDRT